MFFLFFEVMEEFFSFPKSPLTNTLNAKLILFCSDSFGLTSCSVDEGKYIILFVGTGIFQLFELAIL